MSEFEKWYAKEYPLPSTIERGPVGRDAKKQAEAAWKAANCAENKQIRKAYKEYTIGGASYYHDVTCSADRNKPIGCDTCSCKIGLELNHLRADNKRLQEALEMLAGANSTEHIVATGMVRAWLKANGYDGLYTEDCGCLVDDLMPCGEFGGSCEPGYKVPCPGPEDCENAIYHEPCEWHICKNKLSKP